jgi:hypothetical protein
MRHDGNMWAHHCQGRTYRSPRAIDVQTFDRRAETFARAIKPNADDGEIAAVVGELRAIFECDELPSAI